MKKEKLYKVRAKNIFFPKIISWEDYRYEQTRKKTNDMGNVMTYEMYALSLDKNYTFYVEQRYDEWFSGVNIGFYWHKSWLIFEKDEIEQLFHFD